MCAHTTGESPKAEREKKISLRGIWRRNKRLSLLDISSGKIKISRDVVFVEGDAIFGTHKDNTQAPIRWTNFSARLLRNRRVVWFTKNTRHTNTYIWCRDPCEPKLERSEQSTKGTCKTYWLLTLQTACHMTKPENHQHTKRQCRVQPHCCISWPWIYVDVFWM